MNNLHQPLRIGLLITSLEVGGAQKQLVQLAVGLKERGYDVHVIYLMTDGAHLPYLEQLRAASIPLQELGEKRGAINPTVVLRIAQITRREKIDILHSFLFHANLAARLSRLLNAHPKQVSSVRSIREGGAMREFMYRLTDPLCHLTTQNSRRGADHYVNIKAVPRQKMCVTPNSIDTDSFLPNETERSELRSSLKLDNTLAWMAVGRLVEVKNYPLMLQGFSQIHALYPQSRLIIVGAGPLNDVLIEMAKDLQITDAVLFMGRQDDVRRLLNAADAFITTSLWEGMSNVLLEASATALPIVATNVGGNSEVIVDGVTGFLVESESQSELFDRMVKIMSMSESERRRIGLAGREYVRSHFDQQRNLETWISLYKALFNNNPVPCDRSV